MIGHIVDKYCSGNPENEPENPTENAENPGLNGQNGQNQNQNQVEGAEDNNSSDSHDNGNGNANLDKNDGNHGNRNEPENHPKEDPNDQTGQNQNGVESVAENNFNDSGYNNDVNIDDDGDGGNHGNGNPVDYQIVSQLNGKNRAELELILRPIFSQLTSKTVNLGKFLRFLGLDDTLTEDERNGCIEEDGKIDAVKIYNHLIDKGKGREMIAALIATWENEQVLQLIGQRIKQVQREKAGNLGAIDKNAQNQNQVEGAVANNSSGQDGNDDDFGGNHGNGNENPPAERENAENHMPNEQNGQNQTEVQGVAENNSSESEYNDDVGVDDEDDNDGGNHGNGNSVENNDDGYHGNGAGNALLPKPTDPGFEAHFPQWTRHLKLIALVLSLLVLVVSVCFSLYDFSAPNAAVLDSISLPLKISSLNLTFQIPPIHHPTCPRDFFLSEIHRTFVPEYAADGISFLDSSKDILQISVITGKAGIGKSEIFKLYAESQAHFYCRVIWIDARNESTIEQSFTRLYQSPDLHMDSNSLIFEKMLNGVYSALVNDSCPTLLLFDDFDSQRRNFKISSFLPKPQKNVPRSWSGAKTFVLVNTKNPDLADVEVGIRHEILTLDEQTIEESTECIKMRLEYRMRDRDILMLAREQKGLIGNVVKAVKSVNEKMKKEEEARSKMAVEELLQISNQNQEELSLPVIQQSVTDENVEVNLTVFFQVLDKVGDRPFVILSINGASRTGKSFLLSYFLRYFKSSTTTGHSDSDWFDIPISQEFTWRGGAARETIGCHLWSEPFIVKDGKGREIAVLVMDSQGLFDGKTSAKENNQIFTLSSILSSVMIYNVMGQVDDSTVNILQEALREGRTALGPHKMPRLFVIIRDFMHTNQFLYGHHHQNYPVAQQNYYRQFFNGNLRPEILSAREEIEKSFDQFGFFLLPHPGSSFLKASAPSALDPKFKRHLKKLIQLITSNFGENTKKVFGLEVSGLEYKKYLENSMQHIKAPGDDLPDWNNYYEKTRELYGQQPLEKSHEEDEAEPQQEKLNEEQEIKLGPVFCVFTGILLFVICFLISKLKGS